MDLLHRIYDSLLGTDLVVSPLYLALAVPIAYVIWQVQHPGTGFRAWLLPMRIWRHRSTALDLWLFLFGRLLAAAGLVSRLSLAPLVAGWVAGVIGDPLAPADTLSPVVLALILWAFTDFAAYWMHRFYHRNRTLWPLHAVHHSAEVMTPFTTYRQHPVGILVSAVFQSVIIGALMGLIVGLLDPGTAIAEIAGINAFVVAANLSLAVFHHSHIWLSYGPVLERVLISPAQHQIHHSRDPRHHNRNFGTTLALWDWMFGTLYVIRAREELVIGLDAEADAPLMTHRLGPVLLDPLKRMIR